MISAVAPQKRGEVSDEGRRRILALQQARADADEAYRAAVVDELKRGASVRELGRLTGQSSNTIYLWGKARGWPTPEQAKARDDARAKNREWDDKMGDR